MEGTISARGHTCVVLVLNMKRFVDPAYQHRFEEIRGSTDLVQVLQHEWPKRLERGYAFQPRRPNEIEDANGSAVSRMTPEEVGFVMGIFRQIMLEDYAPPEYQVNKENIRFPEPVWENLQFKKLFKDIWFNWDITVRPTMTGMFVVRLKQSYPNPTPLLQIASDVIELQMSFDIPGALNWMEKLHKAYADDEITLQEKEQSIQEFLKWLGSGKPTPSARVDYAPVQWQLAMELCRRFVKEIGFEIPVSINGPIKLHDPDPQLSPPLHDAYVIYHIDELTASANMLARGGDSNNQILVTPQEIQNSHVIRRGFAQLIEGSILRNQRSTTAKGETSRKFPRQRISHVDDIMNADKASWVDELCLLTPRASVIMPSRQARDDELFISTLPAATSQVKYLWYWEAMERMLEFIIEARVLVQLVERNSANLMQDFVKMLRQTRFTLLRGGIDIDREHLLRLSNQAANLSRLAGLGQGLSNPQLWGRAEFAVEKARYLFEQLGVPLLLQHIERNVNHINDLINHFDELYLAALSERGSKQSFWISAGLAGVSLAFILYTLPSFWADLQSLGFDIFNTPRWKSILHFTERIGYYLAPIILFASLLIIGRSLWEWVRLLRLRKGIKR
ncbi:MAG: hypothetical protein KJ638_08070 [Chloroflexi bacterium]|nr:hypothetical protein [Chloroflexota bacterium]